MFRQFINRMIMQYYIFEQNILSKHVNTQFQENVQSTQFTKYPDNAIECSNYTGISLILMCTFSGKAISEDNKNSERSVGNFFHGE